MATSPARASWPVGLEAVRHELHAHFSQTPLVGSLGVELLEWGPGWSEVQLEATAAHTNLVGSVHGGIITALADIAFEVGCNGYGRVCVALSMTCHYTAPAVPGLLTAVCDEVSRSRRTSSHHIDVFAGGELVAWYMALAYRTDRWHLGAERYPASWRDTA